MAHKEHKWDEQDRIQLTETGNYYLIYKDSQWHSNIYIETRQTRYVYLLASLPPLDDRYQAGRWALFKYVSGIAVIRD